MWNVHYTHLLGYGVRRSFTTRAAAQEFIDINAAICRLPNCRLEYVSDYREPTMSELQAMRDRIAQQYIHQGMSQSQWQWQNALTNAMIDRHIYNGRALNAR